MKNSVKNRICRLLALILSLVAVIAVTSVAVPAAVTYDDVKTDDTEELRRRLEKMTEESNALAAKIKSAEQSEADALARKELYDQMHNLYIEQLTVLEGQMAALEAEFAECEREAERLEKEYEQSYENFCGLLRMTYEEGSSSYIAILLGAENLGDLLARAERVAGMIGYNKRLMQRVKEANAELESKKAELDESRAKLAESESQLKVKQEELDAWDVENEKLLAELEAQIQADKESAEKLDASLSAANDELDALVSKLIAEEEERQRKIENEISSGNLQGFAVCMCDVNNLKITNDTLGHKAGDELLINASRIICTTYQHSPVFRIGGDEFAIFLYGQDFDNREELYKKFTSQLSENISSAMGMAVFNSAIDKNISDVTKRADAEMYITKKLMKQKAKKN